MKRISRKRSKKRRIIGLTVLTLVLSCVFVGVFFAVKTGSIFGMFSYDKTVTYVSGEAQKIPEDRVEVTSQNSYSSVLNVKDIVNDNSTYAAKYKGANALPEIPDAKSGEKKGTKDNPFVILEVVPELSQQSLSYFARTKEEGLPFDPVDFGIQVSKEENKSFVLQNVPTEIFSGCFVKQSTKRGIKDYAVFSSESNLPAIFSQTNLDMGYQIYNNNGTVPGAAEKTSGKAYDYTKAPLVIIKELYTVEMKKDAQFVKKLASVNNVDPKIKDLYDNDSEFRESFVDKDKQEIPQKVLADDNNWAWSVTNKETLTITSDDLKGVDKENNAFFKDLDLALKNDASMTRETFMKKYSQYFSETEKGTAINEDNFETPLVKWHCDPSVEKNLQGFFVYVGDNKGDWGTDNEYWAHITKKDSGKEKRNWIYVSSVSKIEEEIKKVYPNLDISSISSNIKEVYSAGSDWHSFITAANKEIGNYFAVSAVNFEWDEKDLVTVETQKATFTFYYPNELYNIKFEYMGVKWNDTLKRMLYNFTDKKDKNGNVTETSDKQYDDYCIKVISVTPDMINAVSQYDTAETLDYIERADMFFVSSYVKGDSVFGDHVDQTRNSFFRFVDVDRDTVLSSYNKNTDQIADYTKNDLEWYSCMKIIKRLSGDKNLPMMYSKQMGYYLDYETDTVYNLLHDTIGTDGTGTICNMGKLYLLSTLFRLLPDKDSGENISPFMKDIYTKIQVIEYNSNNKSPDNTAQYTGYFCDEKKSEGVISEANLSAYKRGYYLWNARTFLPYSEENNLDADERIFDGGNRVTQQGLSLLVKKYSYLASSLTEIYPTSVYKHVDNNLADGNGYVSFLTKGESSFSGGTRLTGTRDPLVDNQNVTIVISSDQGKFITYKERTTGVTGTFLKNAGTDKYSNNEGGAAQDNFTVMRQGVMSHIAVVLSNILNNDPDPTPIMTFSVDNCEKYYQKIDDELVLIDYNSSAEYTDAQERSKTKNILKLKCILNNSANEEASVITSIKMINPTDNSEKDITELYDYDDNLIEKKTNIGFSKELPEPKQFEDLDGYVVSKNNSLYRFAIPFKLSDWKAGYTQIKVNWVARSSKLKGETLVPFQNPKKPNNKDSVDKAGQYATVDIGERDLFDLE